MSGATHFDLLLQSKANPHEAQPKSKKFSFNLARDQDEIGFLNELIKSVMFRIMGYQHPMSDLVSTVMKVETENPLTTYSKFDHDIVKKIVDRMFEEDDPA